MAEVTERWEDNVPGSWYVDQSCILCSLCVDLAPANFMESVQGDHDMVYKQPEGEEELSQSMEAMSQCPVESIGNDG